MKEWFKKLGNKTTSFLKTIFLYEFWPYWNKKEHIQNVAGISITVLDSLSRLFAAKTIARFADIVYQDRNSDNLGVLEVTEREYLWAFVSLTFFSFLSMPLRNIILYGVKENTEKRLLEKLSNQLFTTLSYEQVKEIEKKYFPSLPMDVPRGRNSFVIMTNSVHPMVIEIPVAMIFVGVIVGPYRATVWGIAGILYVIADCYMTYSYIKPKFEVARVSLGDLHQQYNQTVYNIETVKNFGHSTLEMANASKMIEKYVKSVKRSELTRSGLYFIRNIIPGAILVSYISMTHIINNKIGKEDLENIIFLGTYFLSFLYKLTNIGEKYTEAVEAQASLLNLIKVLDMQPDKLGILSNFDKDNQLPIFSDKFPIVEFKSVSFSYDNKSFSIKDISFSIKKGEKIAIVGKTGCGKTTITKLLMGLYELDDNKDSGYILIYGKDIREIDRHTLNTLIGILPQKPQIFRQNLKYNICYGLNDDEPGEINKNYESFANVTLSVGLNKLLRDYEKEPDQDKAEAKISASTVSGGEAQRIGAARLLLKKPHLYILDEPTASLDSYTESLVMRSIFERAEPDATYIIIAHRLTTIKDVDKIIVMAPNGVIHEYGSHKELIKKNGYYAVLWRLQTGDYSSEDLKEISNVEVQAENLQDSTKIDSLEIKSWKKPKGEKEPLLSELASQHGFYSGEKKIKRKVIPEEEVSIGFKVAEQKF